MKNLKNVLTDGAAWIIILLIGVLVVMFGNLIYKINTAQDYLFITGPVEHCEYYKAGHHMHPTTSTRIIINGETYQFPGKKEIAKGDTVTIGFDGFHWHLTTPPKK